MSRIAAITLYRKYIICLICFVEVLLSAIGDLGAVSIRKTVLPGMAIPMSNTEHDKGMIS